MTALPPDPLPAGVAARIAELEGALREFESWATKLPHAQIGHLWWHSNAGELARAALHPQEKADAED